MYTTCILVNFIQEIADHCSCFNCPDTPIDLSKCCLSEMKIRTACQEQKVGCVLKLKKLENLWNKVSLLKKE